MRLAACAREAEVVESIVAGGWPAAVDGELVAHVDRCAVCQEVVTIAQAMSDEHTLACQQAQLPSAGLVWWRAELRARQEAARVAARPMTLMHVLAGACALAALLTGAAMLSPWVRVWIAAALSNGRDVLAPEFDKMAGVGSVILQWGMPALLALGVWLILAPVALYVVLSRD